MNLRKQCCLFKAPYNSSCMKDYSTFKRHNIAILSTEANKQRTQMIPEKENEQFMYLSAS